MFTVAFWKSVAERAVKTYAQSMLSLLGVSAVGLLDVEWGQVLSVAGLAALLSVLTSIVSSGVSGNGPSLTAEVVKEERGAVDAVTLLVIVILVLVVVFLALRLF